MPCQSQITKQLPGMIISGISIGFVYSMIALGYTLVYGVLKFINFAHSEIFMVGGVVAAALVLWRRIGSMRQKSTHDPRRLAGVATGRDVRAVVRDRKLGNR